MTRHHFSIALGDIPEHYANLHEDKLAVVYAEGDSLTWGQLAHRVQQRAQLLLDAGVRRDDIVTIALANSVHYYEHTFAIWKVGATPNFVSPKLPQRELSAIIALASPRVVIAEQSLHTSKSKTHFLSPHVLLDQPGSAPLPTSIATLQPRYWKAATSGGSTGVPKIIVDRLPFDPVSVSGPAPNASLLSAGPLYHNGPFAGTHKALALGCLVAGMNRFNAEATLQLIADHGIEYVHLVPTMMHRIWALPDDVKQRHDLSSVKMFWHYGGPIAPWLKKRWIDWVGAERVSEFYGSTEYLGATSISGREWQKRPGSVGRIQGRSQIKVLREDGNECEPGEVGELYFLPPDPMHRPYHYIGTESRVDADGWESVGDMGYLDREGYLFLADRRVDMILRGGANVYPAEIEAVAESFPGVLASLVVGLRDADLGEVPHAIVQVANAQRFIADALADLKAHLRENLTTYKLPRTLEVVEIALKDDAGKFRRISVRDERRSWIENRRYPDRFLPMSGED